MRLLGGRAVAALATTFVASCSEPQGPPPDAGILIVHAVSTWGPVYRNGHSAGEQVLTNTDVIARGPSHASMTTTTDDSGNARLTLAPGRYAVRLTSDNGCFGAPYTKRVHVFAHHATHIQVGCDGP